jgi:hypothetical protein
MDLKEEMTEETIEGGGDKGEMDELEECEEIVVVRLFGSSEAPNVR